jgi:hypothetical protein
VVRMPIKNDIAFLVFRRFPRPFQWHAEVKPSTTAQWFENEKDRFAAAEAYEEELLAMPKEELEELLATERKKGHDEKAALADEKERKLFYNSPDAAADCEHWGKLAYWTLDEAVALTFGKSPDIVNWERLKGHIQVSQFAKAYERRRDIVARAKATGQLSDPVLPRQFIDWSSTLQIDSPRALIAAVLVFSPQITDWATLYDTEHNAHEATRKWASAKIKEVLAQGVASHAEAIETGRVNCANAMAFAKSSHTKALELGKKMLRERDALIRQLQDEVAVLKSQLSNPPTPKRPAGDKALDYRERDSLLKLIIGMAQGGYGLDFTASRSPITKQIADDLQRCGVGLDEDTVRKYLQEAKDLVPRNETELKS